MARLLIAGTRVSLPKLFLWSLPVAFLLFYTWLNGLWKPADILSTAKTVEEAVASHVRIGFAQLNISISPCSSFTSIILRDLYFTILRSCPTLSCK